MHAPRLRAITGGSDRMSKALRSTSSTGRPAGSRAGSYAHAWEQFESEALRGVPAVDRPAARRDTGDGDALTLFAHEESIEAHTLTTTEADESFAGFLSEEAGTDAVEFVPVLYRAHRRWLSWQVTGVVAVAASVMLLVAAGWLRPGASLDLAAALSAPDAPVAMVVEAPSADTPVGTGAAVDRGSIADLSAQPFPRRDRDAAVAGDGRAAAGPSAPRRTPAAPEPVRASVELLEARSLGIEPAPGPRVVGRTEDVAGSRPSDEARPSLPRPDDAPARVADVPVAIRADAVEVVVPTLASPAADVASSGDEARIQQLLERFKMAYARLDPQAAQAVWPTVDVRALERAFDSLAAQEIAFEDCDLAITEGRARATCQGHGTYVPKVGDRAPRTLRREWAFELERVSSDWQIAHTEAR